MARQHNKPHRLNVKDHRKQKQTRHSATINRSKTYKLELYFPGNSLTDDDNSRHISGSQKCNAMIFAHFANSVPLSISAKRPPTSGALLDAERRNGTGVAPPPLFYSFSGKLGFRSLRVPSLFCHFKDFSRHNSVSSDSQIRLCSGSCSEMFTGSSLYISKVEIKN